MINQALIDLLDQRAGVGGRVTNSSTGVVVTKDLPRVVITLIANPRNYTDRGADALRKATYQIDAFAGTYAAARDVINRITAPASRPTAPGLDGFKGTVQGTVIQRVYFGDDHAGQAQAATGQNQPPARSTVDVLIDYRETA